MPFANVLAMWNREAKTGKKYPNSAKTTPRKLGELLKEAREKLGLGPDDDMWVAVFVNEKKTQEKSPDANIVLVSRSKLEPSGDGTSGVPF